MSILLARKRSKYGQMEFISFRLAGTRIQRGWLNIAYPQESAKNEYSVPEGAETMGRSVFIELNQLKKLNFPQSLKRIEERAFVCCGFSEIWIPNGVTVADDAFRCFKNGLTLRRSGNYTEFERMLSEAARGYLETWVKKNSDVHMLHDHWLN